MRTSRMSGNHTEQTYPAEHFRMILNGNSIHDKRWCVLYMYWTNYQISLYAQGTYSVGEHKVSQRLESRYWLGSTVIDGLEEFQSHWKTQDAELAASKLREILWFSLVHNHHIDVPSRAEMNNSIAGELMKHTSYETTGVTIKNRNHAVAKK